MRHPTPLPSLPATPHSLSAVTMASTTALILRALTDPGGLSLANAIWWLAVAWACSTATFLVCFLSWLWLRNGSSSSSSAQQPQVRSEMPAQVFLAVVLYRDCAAYKWLLALLNRVARATVVPASGPPVFVIIFQCAVMGANPAVDAAALSELQALFINPRVTLLSAGMGGVTSVVPQGAKLPRQVHDVVEALGRQCGSSPTVGDIRRMACSQSVKFAHPFERVSADTFAVSACGGQVVSPQGSGAILNILKLQQ